MDALKIVVMCIVAAAVYGVLLDQVTARVCVEYFTLGHPPVFRTDSPTLLALGWGVLATWWVGLLLGLLLAFAALRGPRPRRTASTLVRSVSTLLVWMAAGALLAGVAGSFASRSGWVVLVGRLAREVPQERHGLFIADLWAHVASYVVGFVGGVVLVHRVWRSRCRPAPPADAP